LFARPWGRQTVGGRLIARNTIIGEVYTVAEVAVLTGFSRQTIIRLFEREPGVIVLKRPETMHKRSYRSIRIPHAIYERVLRKLKVP
jgi:hypothetical protein